MRYAFREFELDTEVFELRHSGALLSLEPKAFDVLLYLLEHRDRVVPKDELLHELWPEQAVTELPAKVSTFKCGARAARACKFGGKTHVAISRSCTLIREGSVGGKFGGSKKESCMDARIAPSGVAGVRGSGSGPLALNSATVLNPMPAGNGATSGNTNAGWLRMRLKPVTT